MWQKQVKAGGHLFWPWFQSSSVRDDEGGMELQPRSWQWVCAAEAAYVTTNEEVDLSQTPGADRTF